MTDFKRDTYYIREYVLADRARGLISENARLSFVETFLYTIVGGFVFAEVYVVGALVRSKRDM